jgi:hypothetical protein
MMGKKKKMMGNKLSSAEGGFPVRRPIADYIIPLNV